MSKTIAQPPPLNKKLFDTPQKRIKNLIDIFCLELDKGLSFHTWNYKSFRTYYHKYLKEREDMISDDSQKIEHTFQKIDKYNYNVWRIK